MIVRTIEDKWFAAVDKRDKHAYLFSYNDINKVLFFERKIALEKVNEAEMHRLNISDEIDYEEY